MDRSIVKAQKESRNQLSAERPLLTMPSLSTIVQHDEQTKSTLKKSN